MTVLFVLRTNCMLSPQEQHSCASAAVSMIESKEELVEGKRRPKHEALDVLYFMRSSLYNLERILGDYEADVVAEDSDFIERCFPCMFKNITRVRYTQLHLQCA